MISSVRFDGLTACMTIEGVTNAEIFREYVKEILLPTLNSGDVLVMDNLSAHKNKETLAILNGAGVEVLFLPPYPSRHCPPRRFGDLVPHQILIPLNYVEQGEELPARSVEARDPEAFLQAIGEALKTVTSKTAANWFAHCGYGFI